MDNGEKQSGFGGGFVQEACQRAEGAPRKLLPVESAKDKRRRKAAAVDTDKVREEFLAKRRRVCKRCGREPSEVGPLLRVREVHVLDNGVELVSTPALCAECRQLPLLCGQSVLSWKSL